jgi:hypothetical protein
MSLDSVWVAFVGWYLFAVAVEAPILYAGLSRDVAPRTRVAMGFWLTGCTLPIVFLAMPPLLIRDGDPTLYVIVAETFAPAAECALFRWRLGHLGARNAAAIIAANLASFGGGRLLRWLI